MYSQIIQALLTRLVSQSTTLLWGLNGSTHMRWSKWSTMSRTGTISRPQALTLMTKLKSTVRYNANSIFNSSVLCRQAHSGRSNTNYCQHL